MERTAYGLRETLFDAIEGVISGKMDRLTAKAVATLSARVLDTVRMEHVELEMIQLARRIEDEEQQRQRQIEEGAGAD